MVFLRRVFDMRIGTLLLLLVLAATAGFVGLNWDAMLAPVDLSIGVATVKMPLGLVMLSLMVLITALFLILVVWLQTSVLLETRRQAKEIKASRELADQAEASRFTELRSFIEAELGRRGGQGGESQAALLARIEQLDRDLRLSIEQSGNTLAAYIGELEDRLEKTVPPSGR